MTIERGPRGPYKAEHERATRRLVTMLTPAEHDAVVEKAREHGITTSSYARILLTQGKLPKRKGATAHAQKAGGGRPRAAHGAKRPPRDSV